MNGILNILKPPGMTSFDVVAYLRKILKIKKIGHTGTLDPGAVGVLPICIGSATKAIEYITDKEKEYRAELTLGVETDTYDSFGQVLQTSEVNISPDEISRAIGEFGGVIDQVPPMYSAIKVQGHKLYELARKGVTVERAPRRVEIFSVKIVNISGNKVIFDVICSKGTYIRSLCYDIGRRLGCGGHMSFLIRTRSGIFSIREAFTLEDVEDMAKVNGLGEVITKVDKVFESFKKIILESKHEKAFINGAFIKSEDSAIKKDDILRVYSKEDIFLGLGEMALKQGHLVLKSKKLF